MKRLSIAFALVVAGASALGACGTGDVSDPSLPNPGGPGSGDDAQAPPNDCIEPACAVFPLPPSVHAVRLTHPQWENSVHDLLRLDMPLGLSSTFQSDPSPAASGFGLDSSALVVASALWHEYRDAAEAAATIVVTAPGALDKLLPDAAKTGDTAPRIQAFVADFLPRAYRRPVLPAEIDAAIAQGEKAVFSDMTSDPFTLRAYWIIAATLQSPYFLYRVEGGEGPVTDGRVRLGGYELASKLSYALWGTMPDAALTAQVAAGNLATNDGIAAVVDSMLKDPRAEAQLIAFHEQLFLADRYVGITRQPAIYPAFYPEFGTDARQDVLDTIRELVIDHPGTVKDLYTSPVAFINERLATIYGVDPTTVPDLAANPGNPTNFAKVTMSPQRIGLLAHAGWLAFEGHAKDPSTIQRGAYIARHVLCIPLGSPPAAAAGADPSKSTEPTNRKRVEATTAGCGTGCHGGTGGVINPLGFSFEGFDALGQFRTKDGDFPIDSSGSIDQVPGAFTDAQSLMAKVADSARTHACYAAHWSAFLNGSGHVDATPKWLSPILKKSLAGATVRDIVTALVQTDAFLTVSRE